MKINKSSLLKALLSPVVFGITLSLVMVVTAFFYYENNELLHEDELRNETPIIRLMRIAHHESIDLRLQARGPRKGSGKVGLLAVDERSVRTVGRWPWPREKMAKAIDEAVKYGAKVLAFDIVFSEPSVNPAEKIYQNIKKTTAIPAQFSKAFASELKRNNSDLILSRSIEKNADHLVLGTFFEGESDQFAATSYPNACRSLMFEQQPEFAIWDNEESLFVVQDPYDFFIPDQIKDIYSEYLNAISEGVREANAEQKSHGDFDEINQAVLLEQLKFCLSWLEPEEDIVFGAISEIWPQIKAEDEDIKEETFIEWAEKFKSKYYRNKVQAVTHWTMNTPLISKGAKHTGFFNALQDLDGSIRRSRLVARTGNHYMPSLSLKAFLVGGGYNANIQLVNDPKNQDMNTKIVQKMSITDNEDGEVVFDIPVDPSGNLIINYAGNQKMFPHASLGDLLSESDEISVEQKLFDPETKSWEISERVSKVKKADFFKDKYFIVGATALGIYDLRVTPFDENYPGAETHVNVLDNLLRNDFLHIHPDENINMLVALIAIGILLSILLSHLGAVPGLLVTVGAISAIALLDNYFLFGNGIVVSIVFPLSLVIILYTGLTFYKYLTEERGKKNLKQTFQKYVSPAIVNEILEDPSNIELGGRKERITVFFSDIRGFTTISEKLDPRALSDLLNSYLTPMTDLVFSNRGTLDKYMGDAVMAFFGAPLHYDDHAANACRCALEQLEKLKELQAEYKKQGLPSLDIGIGLNTGDCSVGNMGSETVRSYTVMGDAVNLGARLEGINKQYGTRIIISEFTYADVKDQFVCREIDLVRVKGKVLPVKIYELVAEKQVPDLLQNTLNSFIDGYQLYHQRLFSKAVESFNQALNLNPDDGPSKLYMQRCQDFIQTPPPDDWDGVFVMTTK